MADFSTLIATLQASIKTNYRQEITGQILQDDLLAIVDAVNRLKQDTLEGYAFHGAPLADGASVAVTQNTFFLVAEGEYTINGSTIEVDAAGVSVIVYDSVNNTTNWYTLFAYDTTPTENSRNAITSGAVAAALAPLATKEDVEAVEQEVAQIAGEAGLAEAVIDTDGAGTEQEFTFRKSGGDGGAYYRKIKGKTLAWNQLVKNGNFVGIGDWFQSGGTIVAANNVLTYTVTTPFGGPTVYQPYFATALGHKFYFSVELNYSTPPAPGDQPYIGAAGYWGIIYSQPITPNTWFRLSGIADDDGTAPTNDLAMYLRTQGLQVGDTIQIKNVFAIDLTRLYGPAIIGLTDAEIIAKYEAEFGTGYHPYNAGDNISNDAEAVETTGVNQWDEEVENGYWDISGFHADARFICSKNKIKVIPGETYFFRGPNIAFEVIGYDAEGDYVQYIGAAISNSQFIIPAGISYITFNPTNVEALTTYNHDICINLSDPAINGQYFPYWKRTLQLGLTTRKDTDGNVPFADGMKGAGTAADWADKVGGEKRMMRVNLGDLEWVYDSFFRGTLPLNSVPNGAGICSKYPCSNDNGYKIYSGIVDKEFVVSGLYISSDTNKIYIRDTAYTDAATFKAAMNGVFLDFEIATPVPFTWAEPLNLGVKVDENGTERAVAPEGATAPSAPFVADTTYTMSVARMVEKLQNL